MKKINTIELRKEMVETAEGKSFYNDLANIKENGDLHFGSYDFGPEVNKMWGHSYDYDVYIENEWKDTIILLLVQEHFKTASEFKNWIDQKSIPATTSSW